MPARRPAYRPVGPVKLGRSAHVLVRSPGDYRDMEERGWHRIEDDGSVRCAFRVEKKHLNGSGNVHGGCFMAFADYCLFAIAAPVLDGPGVTVSFGCEFLDAAHAGELVEGTGEITRAGGSMIFLRGLLKSAERPLFTFSGTIKRVKRRTLPLTRNDASV